MQNFITSAVEQDVLDQWSYSQTGSIISPYLQQILGKRYKFSKGRDHFKYVSQGLGHERIYHVADAPTEIQTARDFSRDYNIVPVGFGNVITVDRVLFAVQLVSEALCLCGTENIPFPISKAEIHVDAAKIHMMAEDEISMALQNAGAESVITGTSNRIMHNLRTFFEDNELLQKRSADRASDRPVPHQTV